MHLPALESLDCSDTEAVAAGLARLPPTLRELHVIKCKMPDTADFSHLRHLRVVTRNQVPYPLTSASAASLPPSLEVLDVDNTRYAWYPDNNLLSGWSVAHLTRLRVLQAPSATIDDAAVAALPPSLHVLNLVSCHKLSSVASFAHLPCLHTLYLCNTCSGATFLPPSLVTLDLHDGSGLTPATVFPDLPALRVLKVSHTGLGNAAIASMPAGLEELSMAHCRNVTQHASLDHLTALRALQSVGTDLSRATIAACRARGCFAPADGNPVSKPGWMVDCLVPLPDGRLASTTCNLATLWEVAAGRGTLVMARELHCSCVFSQVVLHDGHRVAVGTVDAIVVWDTHKPPDGKHTIKRVTIAGAITVAALVLVHSGHLLAGCGDGKLRMVDVDAGTVVTTLAGHAKAVIVVEALLDGRVASGSHDSTVRLWDMGAGTCTLTMTGHTDTVGSLAVLPEDRLASGSCDKTVRLWDAGSGACLRVLTGHTNSISALAVLLGNHLASLSSGDGTIRVWDTRDDTDDAGSALLVIKSVSGRALVPLPGNRLATGGDGVYLWQLPPHRCTT